MARLIYSAIISLDGYVEDEESKFDWAAPDDEVHGRGWSTSAIYSSRRSRSVAAAAMPDNVRTPLTLLGERPFKSGVVHLQYRVSV